MSERPLSNRKLEIVAKVIEGELEARENGEERKAPVVSPCIKDAVEDALQAAHPKRFSPRWNRHH